MSRNEQHTEGYKVAWGNDHAIGWFIDVFTTRVELEVGQLSPVFQIEWDEADWPYVQGVVRKINRGFADHYLIELPSPLREQYAPCGSHVDAYDEEVFYHADRPVISRATLWDGLTEAEIGEILTKYGVNSDDSIPDDIPF